MRIERHNATAMRLAEWLAGRRRRRRGLLPGAAVAPRSRDRAGPNARLRRDDLRRPAGRLRGRLPRVRPAAGVPARHEPRRHRKPLQPAGPHVALRPQRCTPGRGGRDPRDAAPVGRARGRRRLSSPTSSRRSPRGSGRVHGGAGLRAGRLKAHHPHTSRVSRSYRGPRRGGCRIPRYCFHSEIHCLARCSTSPADQPTHRKAARPRPRRRRDLFHDPARDRHARYPPRAPSAHRDLPWAISATPTSRTIRSDSSGPRAPPAAGSPISPRASAATRTPPR